MPRTVAHASDYDAVEADFSARHAEAREETNRTFRASRPINTVNAYAEKAKEWRSFADRHYQAMPAESRYTVTADKVHMWLRVDLMVRQKKTDPRKADGTRGLLSYSALYAYVAGAIDLWTEQRERGINNHTHPAPHDGPVRKLLKVREKDEAKRRRADHVDRGQGTSLETFTELDLLHCNEYCLRESRGIQTILLRDRLALNLSVSCLLRGLLLRATEFADYHLMHLPNEGPQEAFAMCMMIEADKTIQDGQKYLMGAMRARDYRKCSQGSMAMYLFQRWHMRLVL